MERTFASHRTLRYLSTFVEEFFFQILEICVKLNLEGKSMTNKRDLLTRRDKIIYLPLSSIERNRDQPRRRFDSARLNELASSIRENGLLQPITVKQTGKSYMLISGERRLRASHIAGICEIPCIVIEAERNDAASLALIENLQRDNLNFFEEALGISHLMRLCGYTQEEVAKKLGKSQSAISNKLRLLKLEESVISRLLDFSLTERHARALLQLSSEDERMKALDYIKENNLNVNEAESYITSLQNKKKGEASPKQTEQYVIRDVRLFFNTVDRALETMRRAGFKADFVKDEDEHAITFEIKIFK